VQARDDVSSQREEHCGVDGAPDDASPAVDGKLFMRFSGIRPSTG
jgi:hypothetical protein